jgi:hypothetical protein
VNALPKITIAELYDLQSERSQTVAPCDGLFVGERNGATVCVGRHEIRQSGGCFSFIRSVFVFGMQQQSGIITCSVGVSKVSCIYLCIRKLARTRAIVTLCQ